ncbi:Dynactin subunit 6 [Rhodotorula toruloides]|uniref:Dynactin subunit 6 n=1 Tax=Rhodotorula toruloides TaxID=5286 RepID=A0A0K3CD54_RHOTO|nr:Dynactin subunit 6 [Rhodotorula toruloides]PRQ76648.1 Trimeric LpxA-like protein [Rhodotorula toruloides]
MAPEIVDSFKVGTKTVVVADCDLRGDITLGSGTILQPRCTILAMAGPIVFGSNNIVEENVVIVNRLKQPMVIGDNNLFETGCRIESPCIGSHNTFGIRCRVTPMVEVGSNCVVGAGCIVQACPFPPEQPRTGADAEDRGPVAPASDELMPPPSSEGPSQTDPSPSPAPSSATSQPPLDRLDDFTHVFGSENRRRKASGEGSGQSKALFVKHWEYLRDTLPKYHKLKMF